MRHSINQNIESFQRDSQIESCFQDSSKFNGIK
jgi:hypothetical protein